MKVKVGNCATRAGWWMPEMMELFTTVLRKRPFRVGILVIIFAMIATREQANVV